MPRLYGKRVYAAKNSCVDFLKMQFYAWRKLHEMLRRSHPFRVE